MAVHSKEYFLKKKIISRRERNGRQLLRERGPAAIFFFCAPADVPGHFLFFFYFPVCAPAFFRES
jgi:hypothetical protein